MVQVNPQRIAYETEHYIVVAKDYQQPLADGEPHAYDIVNREFLVIEAYASTMPEARIKTNMLNEVYGRDTVSESDLLEAGFVASSKKTSTTH